MAFSKGLLPASAQHSREEGTGQEWRRRAADGHAEAQDAHYHCKKIKQRTGPPRRMRAREAEKWVPVTHAFTRPVIRRASGSPCAPGSLPARRGRRRSHGLPPARRGPWEADTQADSSSVPCAGPPRTVVWAPRRTTRLAKGERDLKIRPSGCSPTLRPVRGGAPVPGGEDVGELCRRRGTLAHGSAAVTCQPSRHRSQADAPIINSSPPSGFWASLGQRDPALPPPPWASVSPLQCRVGQMSAKALRYSLGERDFPRSTLAAMAPT